MSRKTRFELENAILDKTIEIDSMKDTVSGLRVLLSEAEELILDMRDLGCDLPWGDEMLVRIATMFNKIRTSRATRLEASEEVK